MLSDLPDATGSRPPETTDFTEGMKTIYDALHADDDDDDEVPDLILPSRGGGGGRRLGNNNLTSRLYGRQ